MGWTVWAEKHLNWAFVVFTLPFFALLVISWFGATSGLHWFLILSLWGVGILFYLAGFTEVIRGKGRSKWFYLLLLTGLIGFVVVLCLKNKQGVAS